MRAALVDLRRVDGKPDAPRELGPQVRLEHAERVRPQLLDRRDESAARRAGAPPTARRACGGRPPRGRSSPRARRALRHPLASARSAGCGLLPRRGSVARSCAPSRAGAARRAVRIGIPSGARSKASASASVSSSTARELVERSRMADLVLCDRRERDVLLERRRDPGPLGVAPADDQLVVSERE